MQLSYYFTPIKLISSSKYPSSNNFLLVLYQLLLKYLMNDFYSSLNYQDSEDTTHYHLNSFCLLKVHYR